MNSQSNSWLVVCVVGTTMAMTTPAVATEFYVSNSGLDSASGSQSAPWKTLAKANSTLQAGDTVYLRAGTYDEMIEPARSGSAGAPITYTIFPGEEVTVRGEVAASPVVSLRTSYVVVKGFNLLHKRLAESSGGLKMTNVSISGSAAHHNQILDCTIDTGRHGIDRLADGRYDYGISITGADHNLLEGNTIHGLARMGVTLGNGDRFNVVRNNVITDCFDAVYLGGSNSGGVMRGDLIEGNVLGGSEVSDGVQFNPSSGSTVPETFGVIVRNNVIFDNAENCIDLKGTKYIVLDGNICMRSQGDGDGYGPRDAEHDTTGGRTIHKGGSTYSSDVIIRRNVIFDGHDGISVHPGYRIYNNSIVNNRRDWIGPNQPIDWTRKPEFAAHHSASGDMRVAFVNNISGDNGFEGSARPNRIGYIDNNIYFNTWKTSGDLFAEFHDNYDWDALTFSGWKAYLGSQSGVLGGEVHSQVLDGPHQIFVSVPPAVVGEPGQFDFSLRPDSLAIDAGGFLTKTVDGASNSATLLVDDAGFFCDGFGVTGGDFIQVAGNAPVQISAIDYGANKITLASPQSWSADASVSLPYAGSAPDVGAYEFYGAVPQPTCVDGDGDGYGQGAACTGSDCDDVNAAVHPGAPEACDGIDTNCDGVVDSPSCYSEPCESARGAGCSSSGLLAHWAFDERAGSTAADTSGNGHDGNVAGATWTSGVFGGATHFDGVSDYVDVSTVVPSGFAFTSALWMRADSFAVTDGRLISKATGVQTAEHDLMISTVDSNGSIKARVRLQTTSGAITLMSSGPSLELGTWTHLALVYDGSDLSIYQNGTQVASTPMTGSITDSAASTWIGCNPDGTRPFAGSIDDVRLYDVALSEAELVGLMGAPDPECLGDADCDDGEACTMDSCDTGVCFSGFTPDCDSDDTIDLPDGTCEVDKDCQDGDSCTYDVCNEGRCISAVISDCAAEGPIVVGCQQVGGGFWLSMVSTLGAALWRRRRKGRTDSKA